MPITVQVKTSAFVTTHPLIARLYVGDTCVSDEVHHRDMRAVRTYYNGVLAGMLLANAARTGDEVVLENRGPRLGDRHRPAFTTIPAAFDYIVEPGIDLMPDDLN